MTGSARTTIKFGIFAVVMICLTAFIFMTFGQYRTGSTNAYTAVFANASRLKSGDTVRAAGIKVGTVEGVSLQPDKNVVVSFDADPNVRLTAGTKVAVRYLNLVGDRYLDLIDQPGSTRVMPAGAQIPLERTEPALDLDLLLGGLRPVLKGLNPQDVNALTSSLLQILQGQQGTVESLFSRTASFTTTLADNGQVVQQLIDNLDTVVDTLNQNSDQFSGAIDRLQRLVSGLSTDRDPIGVAITALNTGTASIADLLTQARPPLAGTIDQLSRLAPELDRDKGRLDVALQRAPENYRKLVRLGAYGSFFNYYLCGVAFRVSEQAEPRCSRISNKRTGGAQSSAEVSRLEPHPHGPHRHSPDGPGNRRRTAARAPSGLGERAALSRAGGRGRWPACWQRRDPVGVKVGMVTGVSLDTGHVQVDFTVDGQYPLGDDTSAHIQTGSLLGQRILALESTGPSALAPNATIPLSRTSSPYSLADAVGDLTTNTAGTDTTSLNQSLDALSATIDQIAPQLGPTFDGLTRLSRSLNGRNETLSDLLKNASDVTAVLSQRSQQINTLILDANDLFGVLDDRRLDIVGLLANTSAVARELSGLVGDNEKVLAPALEKINAVTAVLEKNRDNIGKALPGLEKFQATQGETVSNGFYYDAFIPNLEPAQILQPFLDYAFGFRRGTNAGRPPDNAGPRDELLLPRNGIPGGSR